MDTQYKELIKDEGGRKWKEKHKKWAQKAGKIGIEEFCGDDDEDSSSQICMLNLPLLPQGCSSFHISTVFMHWSM